MPPSGRELRIPALTTDDMYIQCVQKKVSPPNILHWQVQTCPVLNKIKHAMHSPRSIWVIVAKFHTIPSYHLTQIFIFYKLLSQISVTDMTCLLRTTHATYVTHDVILLINKMLSKEDRVLKGYGAKRIMTEFPGRNFSLASVKSGWLRGLGHFASASLPSPDPWRRPSERTTDCRMKGYTVNSFSYINFAQ